MEEKKKSNKKIILGVAVLAAVLILFVVLYLVFSPKAAGGAKDIVIEVVDDEGATISYDVKTDAEFLRGALDDAEGLTYDGTESEYGLMIETVNGLCADYVENGAYWAIMVDGAYGDYGVDQQPVEDGVTYQLVYTVAE